MTKFDSGGSNSVRCKAKEHGIKMLKIVCNVKVGMDRSTKSSLFF